MYTEINLASASLCTHGIGYTVHGEQCWSIYYKSHIITLSIHVTPSTFCARIYFLQDYNYTNDILQLCQNLRMIAVRMMYYWVYTLRIPNNS